MGKIRYGIKNAHYAKITRSTQGITYGTPVALPGARALSLEAQGESTDEYFDDILWFHADSNSGYSGTLELADLPESFYTDILNESVDSSDVRSEYANAAQNEFALLFEFSYAGEPGLTGSRVCFYRCVAGRPSETHTGKQKNITADTVTLPITAMPRETDELVKAVVKSTSTAYAGFLSAVYDN